MYQEKARLRLIDPYRHQSTSLPIGSTLSVPSNNGLTLLFPHDTILLSEKGMEGLCQRFGTDPNEPGFPGSLFVESLGHSSIGRKYAVIGSSLRQMPLQHRFRGTTDGLIPSTRAKPFN